jgi:hypothetical protein
MSKQPWDHWYGHARWRRRRRLQLAEFPLCRICLEQQGKVVAAEIVDHVEQHKGDKRKFWTGAIQSLCKACHDKLKQREELHGYHTAIGADGYPLDVRHPFYQQTKRNG